MGRKHRADPYNGRPSITTAGVKAGLFYDVGGNEATITRGRYTHATRTTWRDDPPQLMWREHCVTEAWARAKGWVE